MTDRLTIALAQLNPTVGDLAGNAGKIRAARAESAAAGADLVVTPELSLTGYPPEDLVLKPAFAEAARACLDQLAEETADGGPALIVGAPWREGEALHNAALVLDRGRIAHVVRKHELPNYGVFDEKRIFASAALTGPVELRGVRIGLMICEDMWLPTASRVLAEGGAEILLAISASPFETDKLGEREGLARERVAASGLPLVFVNQTGGQDEVIFDGTSFAMAADGSVPVQLPGFYEHLALSRWRGGPNGWDCEPGERIAPFAHSECLYQAAMLGLRDYIGKNGFPGVVIGLSGGIDSALTAAVCVDALGPDKVRTVMMPSRYTSRESLEDAEACATALGVRLDTVSIVSGVAAMDEIMAPVFAGRAPDVSEENIQSRLRGMILMAISNKFGDLVIATGNKSELSVGYATLYGDMCGGYSVLKDLYKTTVFKLARWRNETRPAHALGPEGLVIPERIITKPPTAELRADQRDEDSLPPYETLDDILVCLVERNMTLEEVAARGHDRDTVARIENLLYAAEYKRRQAPPGAKITRKSFSRDRRYPITNRFRTASRPCP